MNKKKKARKVPQVKEGSDARTPCVFNIPYEVEKNAKVKAKDVFEGYSSKKKKCSCKKKS